MNTVSYLNKQIFDFKQYSWAGVLTKAKNRIMAQHLNIKHIKSKHSCERKQKSILILNGAGKTVSEIHRIAKQTFDSKIPNIS